MQRTCSSARRSEGTDAPGCKGHVRSLPAASLPAPEDRLAADFLAEIPATPAERAEAVHPVISWPRCSAATAPKFLHELQETMSQVDAALASRRWHCDRLVQLLTGQNTDGYPVESVSWERAASFYRRLSALSEERAPGRRYQLPTEAE